MTLTVRSLHCYPVKSFRGIDGDHFELTDLGIAHDRAWLAIDGRGRFLSQRHLPAMACITTHLDGDVLVLERQGEPPCPVTRAAGETRITEVWGDRCEVEDAGDHVARWLANALGREDDVRLVRMAPGFRRGQKRPDRYGEDTTTQFADTAPYLVANQASLERLNEALVARDESPVPMDRFRANIVIEGIDAFEEHAIASLEGPGYRLGLRYPRERCVITTMDQRTGEKHPRGEPFETLRGLNPMPDNPRGPAFAELAVLESGDGTRIRIGDELRATRRRT